MQQVVQLLDQVEVKTLTDQLLHEYCVARGNDARKMDERYALLWDAIQSLLLAGGKRFRPFMLLLAYSSYAQTDDKEAIYPAVVAQEILHAAVLMHDDIIDRDIVRYGVKNIAGQYETSYATYLSDEHERRHFAMSSAILAGDILLSDAHRLLWRLDRSPEVIRKADEILSRAVFEVIGGELFDTEATILPVGSLSPTVIARYKTASYSFVSPLSMGAALAAADEKEITLLEQFSEYVGIGYQLRDDLLGVFGNTAQTGKSTSSDITEGKRTLLIEQFDEIASQEQKADFYALFHNPTITNEELERAKQLLVEAGARKKIEDTIEDLKAKALTIVSLLAIPDASRSAFKTLIDTCLSREV